MIQLDLKFAGAGSSCGEIWPDLNGKSDDEVLHTTEPVQIAVLPAGMASGRPSVMMRANLADGRVLLFETSLRLFQAMSDAMQAAMHYVNTPESEKN